MEGLVYIKLLGHMPADNMTQVGGKKVCFVLVCVVYVHHLDCINKDKRLFQRCGTLIFTLIYNWSSGH